MPAWSRGALLRRRAGSAAAPSFMAIRSAGGHRPSRARTISARAATLSGDPSIVALCSPRSGVACGLRSVQSSRARQCPWPDRAYHHGVCRSGRRNGLLGAVLPPRTRASVTVSAMIRSEASTAKAMARFCALLMPMGEIRGSNGTASGRRPRRHESRVVRGQNRRQIGCPGCLHVPRRHPVDGPQAVRAPAPTGPAAGVILRVTQHCSEVSLTPLRLPPGGLLNGATRWNRQPSAPGSASTCNRRFESGWG